MKYLEVMLEEERREGLLVGEQEKGAYKYKAGGTERREEMIK